MSNTPSGEIKLGIANLRKIKFKNDLRYCICINISDINKNYILPLFNKRCGRISMTSVLLWNLRCEVCNIIYEEYPSQLKMEDSLSKEWGIISPPNKLGKYLVWTYTKLWKNWVTWHLSRLEVIPQMVSVSTTIQDSRLLGFTKSKHGYFVYLKSCWKSHIGKRILNSWLCPKPISGVHVKVVLPRRFLLTKDRIK